MDTSACSGPGPGEQMDCKGEGGGENGQRHDRGGDRATSHVSEPVERCSNNCRILLYVNHISIKLIKNRVK